MTTTTRLDLFSSVHKGLRAALFETATLVARTDFADADAAGSVASRCVMTLRFLEEHAEHEDAVVMPELAALAPELHVALQSDHARTDGLQREIAQLLERLARANAAERVSLGRRVHDRIWALAAEHVRHMQREEQEAMRMLWAHRSDAELQALHGRVLARIAPPRTAEWLALMLPAMSVPERAALIGELRAKVPADALGAILAPARVALGPAWAATDFVASL
jgi:hypothetical protein